MSNGMPMPEQIGRIVLKMAYSLAYTHRFRCNSFDCDDLAMIAVERAVAKFPEWNPDLGSMSHFLFVWMEGAIRSYLRLYSKSACKTRGYRDRDTIRFGALQGDRDMIPGDTLEGSNLDCCELVDTRDALEYFRRRHRVAIEDYQLLLLYYGEGLSLREVGLAMQRSPHWAEKAMKRLTETCPELPKPSAAHVVYSHAWRKKTKRE